jgi:hypothetical protein
MGVNDHVAWGFCREKVALVKSRNNNERTCGSKSIRRDVEERKEGEEEG